MPRYLYEETMGNPIIFRKLSSVTVLIILLSEAIEFSIGF